MRRSGRCTPSCGLDSTARCATACWPRTPVAAVKRPGVAQKEAKHASAVDVNKVLLCADGLRYRNVTASHEPVGVKPLLQHGLSQDEREDSELTMSCCSNEDHPGRGRHLRMPRPGNAPRTKRASDPILDGNPRSHVSEAPPHYRCGPASALRSRQRRIERFARPHHRRGHVAIRRVVAADVHRIALRLAEFLHDDVFVLGQRIG